MMKTILFWSFYNYVNLFFEHNFEDHFIHRLKFQQLRGDLCHQLLQRLNVTDAPHFYNLASLEGTLQCLMHVTARYRSLLILFHLPSESWSNFFFFCVLVNGLCILFLIDFSDLVGALRVQNLGERHCVVSFCLVSSR